MRLLRQCDTSRSDRRVYGPGGCPLTLESHRDRTDRAVVWPSSQGSYQHSPQQVKAKNTPLCTRKPLGEPRVARGRVPLSGQVLRLLGPVPCLWLPHSAEAQASAGSDRPERQLKRMFCLRMSLQLQDPSAKPRWEVRDHHPLLPTTVQG